MLPVNPNKHVHTASVAEGPRRCLVSAQKTNGALYLERYVLLALLVNDAVESEAAAGRARAHAFRGVAVPVQAVAIGAKAPVLLANLFAATLLIIGEAEIPPNCDVRAFSF